MNGATSEISLDLDRVSGRALVVGAGALVLCLVLALVTGWQHFFNAYLMAYMLWFGLTLGCLAVTMLYHVVGGRWGHLIRPILETGSKAIPLMALLFLPLLLGLRYNYPWAQDDWVQKDPILLHQSKWLNPAFFTLRAVIYFAVWALMMVLINAGARQRDLAERVDGPKGGTSNRLRAISGPGIVLYAVTVTLAAVDWVMSIEPRWFSTIYGLAFIAGQGLSTISFAAAALMFLTRVLPEEVEQEKLARAEEADKDPAGFGIVAARPDSMADRDLLHGHAGHGHAGHGHGRGAHEGHAHPALSPTDWGDLGQLMFLFTMLWAYTQLSQFLIIWSGNLPSETQFYKPRVSNSWGFIAIILILCHFAVPFFSLLRRDVKRDAKRLGMLAVFVLVMRQLDLYWQIEPTFTQETAFSGHIFLNLLTPIALGGIWVAFVAKQFKGRRILPQPQEGVITMAKHVQPATGHHKFDLMFEPEPAHAATKGDVIKGYEYADVQIKGFIVFTVFFAVSTVVILLVTWGVMAGMSKFEEHSVGVQYRVSVKAAPGNPVKLAEEADGRFPEPRLQPSPYHNTLDSQDMAKLRGEQQRTLTSAGWQTDEKTGRLTITHHVSDEVAKAIAAPKPAPSGGGSR